MNELDLNVSYFGSSNSPNRDKNMKYTYSKITGNNKTERTNITTCTQEPETATENVTVMYRC